MSGGGTETPVACEAAPGGGGKKRDSLGTPSAAHLIIKDLGEIHSRLLDHRPVTQGEIRYFVKEFEELTHHNLKASESFRKYQRREQVDHMEKDTHINYMCAFESCLRELRVLENLKNMIQETNERTLPKCREMMQDSLEGALQKLQAANDSICRLQQREQDRKKVINDHLTASEKQRLLQWEEFMKQQPQRRAEVDDEHRRAMERLREQYAAMEKDLAKFSTF